MKYSIVALALAFASPALAQAPAAQHQGHANYQQAPAQDHSQHGQPQNGQQDPHQGHAAMAGCCADRNDNGRMDCCENMASGGSSRPERAQAPAATQAQPQAHSNH